MGEITKYDRIDHAQLMGEIGEARTITRLRELGFTDIKRHPKARYDITGSREDEKFVIEVKYGSSGINVEKAKAVIDYAEENNCIPLLIFVDDTDIYFFKHVDMRGTTSLKSIKKCLDGLPRKIVLYMDGGRRVTWSRID